jgi:hypothetical protein
MVRVLRDLRIDEISSVDKGAGEGCRVVLYKRDDSEASGQSSSTDKRNSEAKMAADHFIEVCKKLGDGDPSIIAPSEHELTAHIQKYASDNRRAGESPAAAFNRIFNAQDDEGLALRKAVQVAKRVAGFPV